MAKQIPSTTPVAARPRPDVPAEASGGPVASLQERVVQAAFNELQAQNKLLGARAANMAQQVATLTVKLEQAQEELAQARALLNEVRDE